MEIDALEVHKQKKAGASPYDSLKEPKIKLENDMDTDDEMDFSSSAYIPVTHVPNDEVYLLSPHTPGIHDVLVSDFFSLSFSRTHGS